MNSMSTLFVTVDVLVLVLPQDNSTRTFQYAWHDTMKCIGIPRYHICSCTLHCTCSYLLLFKEDAESCIQLSFCSTSGSFGPLSLYVMQPSFVAFHLGTPSRQTAHKANGLQDIRYGPRDRQCWSCKPSIELSLSWDFHQVCLTDMVGLKGCRSSGL